MRNNAAGFFPKVYLALTAPFAVVALSLLLTGGAAIGHPAEEPQATTVTSPFVETRLVETRTVQYVDKPVTEVRYVERIEKVPAEWRHFRDLDELEQWLESRRSIATIRFQSPDAVTDCDDYALELQHRALADGYIVSFQIIGQSEYNALFKTPLPPSQSLHAINLVIIGNSAYYIEPQTDEVVLAAQLD